MTGWPLWLQIALGIVVGLAGWRGLRLLVAKFGLADIITVIVGVGLLAGLLFFTSLDLSTSKWIAACQVLAGGSIVWVTGWAAVGNLLRLDEPVVVNLPPSERQEHLARYYAELPGSLTRIILLGLTATAFGGFVLRDYGAAFTGGFTWYHWLWS